jgi:tRNA-modifying protein YgfZ
MSNWFSLPHLTSIRISGPDAFAFCQSQFTADFTTIETGCWQITAWCNPKGRCLTTILARLHEDHVDLVFPRTQLVTASRLKLYAIGRKVEFSDPLSVAGHYDSRPPDGRLNEGRTLEIGVDAETDDQALRAWRIADICESLPWLEPAQSGHHLPQALGLEHNKGLSYRKGCFPGQEVIARVHYLGRVKNRLLGFELSGELPDPLPADLRLESDKLTGYGELIDHIQVEAHAIGLAICPSDWPDQASIHLSAPCLADQGRVVAPDLLCYHQAK